MPEALEATEIVELLEFELAIFKSPPTILALGGANDEMLSAVSDAIWDDVVAIEANGNEMSRSV